MTPRSSPTALDVEARFIRVLLVHEYTLVRAGLRMLIESQDGSTVVAEADTYPDAITLTSQNQPDVILFSHAIGCEDGLEHIPVLLETSSQSKVLVLTSTSDPDLTQRALSCGAIGLISKDEAPALLLKAIQKVMDGEAWVDRVSVSRLIAEISRSGIRMKDAPVSDDIESLTKRERDITQLVAQGLKNKQIAERLAISVITVRHHLTSTFAKLGVSDRFELMIYAYKHGICGLPE